MVRVLTVEDNPATRMFVRLTLEGGGYDVVEAETAAVALRLLPEVQPEVLLIDLALPDMNGLELAHEVRERFRLPACRIVAFTGSLSEREADAVRSGLLDELLLKPADPAELLTVLTRTTSEAHGQRFAGRAVVVELPGTVPLQPSLKELGLEVEGSPPDLVAGAATRGDVAIVVVPTILAGMSGFELAWELRRGPNPVDVPVLLVGPCEVDDVEIARARRVGATWLAHEEADPIELRSAVEAALGTPNEAGGEPPVDPRGEYVAHLERCARRHRPSSDGASTARRLLRLSLIEDVEREFAATGTLDDALRRLLDELVHLVGGVFGVAYVSDGDGDLAVRARVGPVREQADEAFEGEVRRRWSTGLLETAVLSPVSADRDSAELDERVMPSLAVAPLTLGAERLGCIVLASKRDDLPTWRQLLDEVRTHVSMIVRLARAAETASEGERVAHTRGRLDALTGLPNAVVVVGRLATLLSSGATGTLLLVGITRFRRVNARHGYRHGNLVLQALAARLSAGLAASHFTVGRVGGERFAVVAAGLLGEQAARELAAQVAGLVAQPLVCEGVEHRLTASVGIVHFPAHGTDAQALLWRADTAMRAAREAERTVAVFDPVWDPEAALRLLIDQELRTALGAGGAGLSLAYQPIVEVASRDVVGLEALLRWELPHVGSVSPSALVTVAEESGLIGELGRWVLGAACEQLRSWRELPSTPPRLSVNVAAQQLLDDRFVASVAQALRERDLPGTALAVEITETAALHDVRRSTALLERVRALGVQVVLDDFGTGYSSLAYLQQLPLDAVKIDRSFVRELPNDASNRAVVAAIIELAHGLGLTVVAEGVETEAQLDELGSLGCDQAQGWLFAAALAPGKLAAFLELPVRKS